MFYNLTGNKKKKFNTEFTQIQRATDGELGGWIESESNLVQDGSWIDETSYVFGSSVVSKNSIVSRNSVVKDSIIVNSSVYNNSKVWDSHIKKNSVIKNNSEIMNKSLVVNSITDNSIIKNNSVVSNLNRVNNSVVNDDSIRTNPLTANPGKHPVTISDNKTVIGCEVHEHDYWLENIEEIGKKHGYSYDEIELYRSVMTLLINQKKKELQSLNYKSVKGGKNV